MSTPYSPNGDPMPASLPIIDTGELANEDSLFTDIIKPMIDGIGYAQGAIGTGSIIRVVSVNWLPASGFVQSTGAFDSWVDAGTGGVMSGIIDIPNGAKLDAFYVYVDPKNGHAAVPAVTPTAAFSSISVTTGAVVSLGLVAQDPSASAAAYDVYHPILLASASMLTSNRASFTYGLIFTGESGADSDTDLKAFGRVKIVYHF